MARMAVRPRISAYLKLTSRLSYYGPEATLEEWEHLTIVNDSEEQMKRLYVNGELAVEQEDIVAENDTKPFNIGAGGDIGTAYFFKGDIDDVILWSRALDAGEVADVHANGLQMGGEQLVPGLIAYWPFDGNLDDAVGDSHGEGESDGEGEA